MDNQDQPESTVRNQLSLVFCSNDHTCSSSITSLIFQSTQLSTSEVETSVENLQDNGGDKDLEVYFDLFPKGYRFKPFDHELIESYLRKKINNEPLPPNQIREVELYNYDPETLAAIYKTKRMDELYFFTPRNRKYPNGGRPNRAVTNGNGYWKATGADKGIEVNNKKVGLKKSLVFYRGKPPKETKTNWIMHEYTIADLPKREKTSQADMKLDDWVLCKIRKNVNNAERSEKAESEANQDITIEINQVLNPGAAGVEASLIDSSQGGNNLTPEPLHVPQPIQQLQILTPEANLVLQENVFAISSASAVNYSYGEAGASSQMQAPFVHNTTFSTDAQQMVPIEDLAPWTNDPLLTQTNSESWELFLNEHFPQDSENGVFDIPPWDPLYSSTKDEEDTKKN